MCAVVALFWTSVYTYVPVLSSYSYSLDAGAVMVGSIVSSFGLTQMCFRIPLGITSDKLKMRKIFVICGCGCSAISGIGLFMAKTPTALLIFRAMAGAAASAWVTMTVLFSSYYDIKDSAHAMAKITLFNNVGQVSGPLLGGFTAQFFGSRYAFLLAFMCAAAAFILSFGITEHSSESKNPMNLKDIGHVATDRSLIISSILAMIYQMINQGGAMGFTPQYINEIGGTASQQGYISSLTIGGMMVTSILAMRFLLKKFGMRKLVLTGQLMMALFTAAIPVFGKNVWLIFIFQFCAGLGNGLTLPQLMGLAVKDISPDKRSTAMGFFQSIYAIGMFVGPQLMGVLNEYVSTGMSIFILGIFGLSAFFISLFFLKDREL